MKKKRKEDVRELYDTKQRMDIKVSEAVISNEYNMRYITFLYHCIE